MPLYKISSTLYLDKFNECYKTIITINDKPDGPLGNHVKSIQRNKLSPFDETNNCCNKPSCYNAIYNLYNSKSLLCIDDLTDLFNFLSTNGYTIDTTLTKIYHSYN